MAHSFANALQFREIEPASGTDFVHFDQWFGSRKRCETEAISIDRLIRPKNKGFGIRQNDSTF